MNRRLSLRWIGLTFMFLGFSSGPLTEAASVSLEKLEAVVNSTLILKTDLSKFRETLELRAQLDPLFAGTTLATKGATASDAEIIDFLIQESLISNSFAVSQPEVEQSINTIQSTNRIDRNSLKKAILDQGFKFEDYFELIRISISKKNLIERDIRTKVSISDEDVKNHFINSLSKDQQHRSYHLRLITVTPTRYKSVSAAKEIIDRALREIRAGESFEEVAKRISDDATAPAGGDLGTLTEDQISKNFREVVKDLQIGQTSDVFGSPESAYFVLKLVDIQSAEEERFQKMKETIREQLAASEYQRQIQLWLDRHRQSAYIRLAGQEWSSPLQSTAGNK